MIPESESLGATPTGPSGRSPRIVGVRLDRNGPLHFFEAGDIGLAIGDTVLVPDPAGPRAATVVVTPDQVLFHPFASPLPRLLSGS